MGAIGFILMCAGIVACGIAFGTMYTAQIGWIFIGSGAILLGLLLFVAEQRGANGG